MPIYSEFEISLRGIEPRIWRRFLITKDATFHDLHEATQTAFRWEDCHMWEFLASVRSRQALAAPRELGERGLGEHVPAAGSIKLTRYFGARKRRRCVYVYDFGDYWVPDVRYLLSVAASDRFHQRLLGGDRAGPLEDCGGVRGSHRLVEVFRTGVDPWGEDASKVEETLGYSDPEEFDIEEVNFHFAR